MKIFGLRNSLLGDVVTCLPMIHILQKMYGENVSITQCLANKCKQMAPLLIGQPGIESIYITQDEECLNDKEREWISKDFDLFIETNPPEHNPRDWYNHKNMVDETIIQAGEEYYEVFQTLPEELKKPRLYSWWDNGITKIIPKRVAIHCVAGYSKDSHRSPSMKWWSHLCQELNKLGYIIEQYGHPDDPKIPLVHHARFNYGSLFEQISQASQCSYYIGTDSGFSIIMAALGKQKRGISLMTDWLPQHHNNPYALAPVGWNDNITTLFAPGGCDNISIKNVLEVIENSN